MWPQNLHDAWLLSLPTLVPYMILMSLKMMERKTPFTSETFLHEYDYIVGKLGFITDYYMDHTCLVCSIISEVMRAPKKVLKYSSDSE